MIHWDEWAAIVALIAIILTFSTSTTTAIAWLGRRSLYLLWPPRVHCGTLCWEDIPDGPIHSDLEFLEHDETSCLEKTFGVVFERAWKDNARRKKRVVKPLDLDVGSTYLRTDVRTLRAFMLATMNFEDGRMPVPPYTFQLVGKTMTAHCAIDEDLFCCTGQIDATKQELQLWLAGYPPLHRPFHLTPAGEIIESPIRDKTDIERGGWIVHAGLRTDQKRCPPSFHNMAMEDHNDSTEPTWRRTKMRLAVERLQVALANIHTALPEDDKVPKAIKLVKDLTSPGIELGTSSTEIYALSRTEQTREWERSEFLGGVFWYYHSDRWTEELKANEWRLAMQVFNHRQPLSEAETALLKIKLLPVLQAAIAGLLQVLLYGSNYHTNFGHPTTGTPLPAMSELQGYKYVYLKSCSGPLRFDLKEIEAEPAQAP